MKKLFILVFAWYVQDIVQIMMTQTFLAPEIYLIALIWCVTQETQPRVPWRWFAAALGGGLLMDLRWIGVPGLCAALYTASVLAAHWAWFQIPPPSRRMAPYVVITALLCAVMTLSRLLFWDAGVLAGRIGMVVGAQWTADAAALLLSALARPYSHDDKTF